MTNERVRILDPAVSERIAAGEVIERPMSVVKELVENALDAGATEIAVHLEDGGRASIEVTDNGRGMHPDDLLLSLERHATSKVTELSDLDRIRTLGFRGEALPSIAAVAELTLTSRSRDARPGDDAYAVRGRAPEERQARDPNVGTPPEAVTHGHFLGSPHGTRVEVRNLFALVPARLKFLKSPSSEVGQIRELLERVALGRPGTGFSLTHGERSILTLRPQTEAERVRSLLADDEDAPLLTREESRGELKLRAYWLQGSSSPQMKRVLQVVNGRALRDRLLQQALLSPFRQTLLPGQFPALALFLELDPAHLDVNVHPTKTEVRFLEPGAVFSAVSSTYEKLIRDHGQVGFASGELPLQPSAERAERAMPGASQPAFHWTQAPRWEAADGLSAREASERLLSLETPTPHMTSAREPEAATRERLYELFRERTYVGTLFQTYLLFDFGDELGLIDQHAADERIRYERLSARLRSTPRSESLPSQQLLVPESIAFDPERRRDFEARLPWLERLGFEAELFGEDRALFRGVPPEWGLSSLKSRLANLVERLLEASAPDGDWALDESLFEKLASEACHSSVRAGDRLEPEEARALVDSLFTTSHPWNCPHGRPTIVRVPRARLEEWFQRRVPG